MNKKLLIFGITVLLLSVGLSGCIDENEENKLRITKLGKKGSIARDDFLWTITVGVSNSGPNDVDGANLVILLYSGDNIVASKNEELGNLKSNWEDTQEYILINENYKNRIAGKVVATIYLGEEVLDTQSMTW